MSIVEIDFSLSGGKINNFWSSSGLTPQSPCESDMVVEQVVSLNMNTNIGIIGSLPNQVTKRSVWFASIQGISFMANSFRLGLNGCFNWSRRQLLVLTFPPWIFWLIGCGILTSYLVLSLWETQVISFRTFPPKMSSSCGTS